MDWEELKYQIQLRWQYLKSRNSGICRHFEPKIAFLFHNTTPLDHYLPVVSHLAPEAVEFVCMHGCPDQETIRGEAEARGIVCRTGEEVMKSGTMYAAAVSNHYIHVFGNRFILKDIAFTNVRMVYGLGKKGWHFSYWNKIYDHILCFGPYQSKEFKRLLNVSASGIGYARYDEFYSGSLQRDALLKELGCDPAKPTVVWLPTHGVYSSINRWAAPISVLSRNFNVIVRPHILSVKNDPERMAALNSVEYTNLLEKHYNNTKLFTVADYVLADYGGASFSALYCDKNLLLLNVPETSLATDLSAESEEFYLRKHLLCLDHTEGDTLERVLRDERLWQEQVEQRARLRDYFFTANYGTSGKAAAEKLKALFDASVSRHTSSV